MKTRRLIFVLLLSALTLVNAVAQKIIYGSLEELANSQWVNFEVDYSKASIHGMSEQDFALYEVDWDKDMPVVVAKFLGNLSDRLEDKLIFVKDNSSSITLRWVVLHINTKGDTTSELHVVDQNENILARIVGLKAEGGTFGTKLNLIKDGAEESGKIAGSFLYRQLKKVSRKTK